MPSFSQKNHVFFTKKSCQARTNVYNSAVLAVNASTYHKINRGCSSVVERNLAKVDVVGSNPIIRSQNKNGASSDVPFFNV